MRVLLLLISSCLICCSCGTSKIATDQTDIGIISDKTPFFREGEDQSVFRGGINVYKHYFSGIFALKQEAENKYRMVLMSEVGMTLFDMSFTNDTYKLNYCIEPIKKKNLLNVMYNDFLLLAKAPKKQNLRLKNKKCLNGIQVFKEFGDRDFYFYKDGVMNKIVSKNFLNRTKIEFNELNDGVSNFIRIQHSPIKLKMELKRIK